MIPEARILYIKKDFGVDLDEAMYALNSTTIDLCLSLFPWAYFRKNSDMHTQKVCILAWLIHLLNIDQKNEFCKILIESFEAIYQPEMAKKL